MIPQSSLAKNGAVGLITDLISSYDRVDGGNSRVQCGGGARGRKL